MDGEGPCVCVGEKARAVMGDVWLVDDDDD